jgi:hypothetical protein
MDSEREKGLNPQEQAHPKSGAVADFFVRGLESISFSLAGAFAMRHPD